MLGKKGEGVYHDCWVNSLESIMSFKTGMESAFRVTGWVNAFQLSSYYL